MKLQIVGPASSIVADSVGLFLVGSSHANCASVVGSRLRVSTSAHRGSFPRQIRVTADSFQLSSVGVCLRFRLPLVGLVSGGYRQA